jgi:hypothetical protein
VNALLKPVTEPSPIDVAAAALLAAKENERLAIEARIDAEQALIALAGDNLKPEGANTLLSDAYKVTITTKVNRSVDQEKLAEIAKQVPGEFGKRLIRWKPDLVLSELRYIEANEPQVYAIVAQAITAKPAKPSVEVKAVEAAKAAA